MADPVTITWAPPAARYSLRTRTPAGLPSLLASAPFGAGQSPDQPPSHALGLGPDEWLLILPDGAAPPAVGGPHALTDVGHRSLGLIVTGQSAAALIQGGCALDLSLAAFPVGKVTRTLYEDVEILLWRTGEAAFRIEAWRSFAGHVQAALTLCAGDLPNP